MQTPSLSERYGTRRPTFTHGRLKYAVIAVLVAAVIGAAVFTGYRARNTVTFKDVSFAFPEKGRATVDFSVTKHPTASVQCAVQVLSEKHAIVGWKVITVPANTADAPGTSAGGTTTNHRVGLRTVSDGVNGGVHSCWISE